MNHGAHVLVVSKDEMLLQTRQLILGAFFQVCGAGRIQEAEALISRRAFDLIVLCYSLSPDDCRRIAEMTERQSPRPKILTLRAAGTATSSLESDQELVVEAGPFGLLKKSTEMLGVDLRVKQQPAYPRNPSAA